MKNNSNTRKKAAIITLYGEFNYGNRLQNYAVNKILLDCGYLPTTIVHRYSNLKAFIRRNIISVLLKLPLCVLSKFSPVLERKKIFRRFNKRYIPTIFYKSMNKTISNKFQLFVVGSDQVWNPHLLSADSYKEMFLLDIPKEKKKCISPSFGIDSIPVNWTKEFADALNTFSSLNIREESGADIIEYLTGKKCSVVIDPTLFLSAEQWLSVAKTVKNIPKKYALNYFLGTPYNNSNFLDDIEFINLSPNDKSFYYSCGPSEFIYLIANSECVFTDSFHACVFSIIFAKPFKVFRRNDDKQDMFNRIISLLKLFEIDYIDNEEMIIISPDKRDEILAFKKEEITSIFRNA